MRALGRTAYGLLMGNDLSHVAVEALASQKVSSQVNCLTTGSLEQLDSFVRAMKRARNPGAEEWTVARDRRFASGWKQAHQGKGWGIGRVRQDSIGGSSADLKGSGFDVLICTDGLLRVHLAATTGHQQWQGYGPVPTGWQVEAGFTDQGWEHQFVALPLAEVLTVIATSHGLTAPA